MVVPGETSAAPGRGERYIGAGAACTLSASSGRPQARTMAPKSARRTCGKTVQRKSPLRCILKVSVVPMWGTIYYRHHAGAKVTSPLTRFTSLYCERIDEGRVAEQDEGVDDF